MPYPIFFEGFGEVIRLLQEAKRLGKVTCECKTMAAAKSLRHALYACRARDRARSYKIYEEGHPHRGKSDYEELSFIVDGSKVIITKQRLTDAGFKVTGPDGEAVDL